MYFIIVTFTIFRSRKEIDEPQPGPSGLQRQPYSNEGDDSDNSLSEISESTAEATVVAQQQAPQQFGAMLESENYFLRQDIDKLVAEKLKLEALSFCHIENNDHIIMVYTGIPTKDIFVSLFKLFENLELKYFRQWQVVNVQKIDQLLLTLMKLKLNLLNDDLAFRFKISRETVSNIFKTWLFALHEILFKLLMAEIPSRHKNKMCMPASFSSFTNCRIIIDCTEVNTIQPGKMDRQKSTYSTYKHRNTLKGLVGVAPNGVVTFVSELYPGSTSDKKITQHCGLLQKLEAGDLVLADKGFLITDMLPQGVSLNVPPFLTTAQFTSEQVVRTRTIARARIHVERAIKRIKSFNILNMIPSSLIPHSSQVFQVCGALTNLQFPLIKEVETLFDW